jgi:AraC-like DNA-binding protein
MKLPTHHAQIIGTPLAGVYATDIESGLHFARHSHDEYGFGFLVSGGQRWLSSRGIVRGYPGQVISTNPGEIHDGSPLQSARRRWRIIHVGAGQMRAFIGTDRLPMIAKPVIDDPALLRALSRTFELIRSEAEPLACEEALVESCVSLMTRHGTNPSRSHPAAADVSSVRDRLADSTASQPSLAELAELTGLSRFQVLRRFTKVYGVSPHAWAAQQRVERARSLIRAGEPLSRAALIAGFSDQSHMNRAFVRQLGFTPGRYQKAVLPMQRARCSA